ncbi:winged helix-turn-helix domain-containing protein [Halorarius halobius]|uniref:winged helix-turn-helix domain-containing protein n=1 Tax=Halorarius halobius TaxID=2962671 RepID=UPI0020CBE167|nr:helix-turn-helix domain-containing protein [Halorarius halobius]
MSSNPFAPEEPDVEVVLDALDDDDCRRIIRRLDESMTASEVSDTCDIPRSTAYRKLELLSEASLVDEEVEVRSDGHHTTRYLLDFETVHIDLDDDRDLDVRVERPEQSPEERVATLWEEVRKET